MPASGTPEPESPARKSLSVSTAHELRNSLDSAINLLYALEKENSFTENGRRLLSSLRDELTRMTEIARGTLAEHRSKTMSEILNLGDLVDAVLSLYKSRLDAKNITVSCQFRFMGGISLQAGKMRELFANLFLNAIDAMTVGGTLTVRLAERHEWAGQHRRGVRVLVADNGTGIEERYLKRIFEPFFTTKGMEGSGMGLSIVQEIVQEHGGVLKVRSSVRPEFSGTVLSIFLPQPALRTNPPLQAR